THQIVKRLWCLLFVERVLVDDLAQSKKILAKHGFFRPQNRLLVNRNCHCDKDQQQTNHNHQLDQSEAPAASSFAVPYHSLYFVPPSAVPSDLLKTPKPFCPPQESDAGSSCIERKPHSALPVIGSTGILRRNFSFFPPTSTPLTSVSRSGG